MPYFREGFHPCCETLFVAQKEEGLHNRNNSSKTYYFTISLENPYNFIMDGGLDKAREATFVNDDTCTYTEFVDDDENIGCAIAFDAEISQKMSTESAIEEQHEGTKELVTFDDGESNKAELIGNQILTGEDDRLPRVGMVFNSYGEVVSFYKRYAIHVGFGVTIKKSAFTKKGLCRQLTLVCHKWGKGQVNAIHQYRSTKKTNCEATLSARLRGDGLMHVVEVKLEHNHALNPLAARTLRCYKKLPSGIAKDFATRASGCEDLASIDNLYMEPVNGYRLKLPKGDYDAIQQFFAMMQIKNPNFFYSSDLNEEGQLRNIFWADSRARVAYQYYGDVIYFDSTCLHNNFEIPLVFFIGSNNHGQLVLLGCGLLFDETTESYFWLFKSWLTSMRGRPPNAIVTDHSKAIQDAVVKAFPEVRYCISLPKIIKRIPEHLKECTESKIIQKVIKELIYDSMKVDEFEQGWMEITEKYGLKGNEWFSFLYDNRQLWAPVFLKDTFWAGLSTCLSEESVSTFFEGSLSLRTSLKSFLSKYEMVIQTKYELEAQADFQSFHKARPLVSKFHMEEQICKAYTLNMFRKFQEELKAIIYCQVSLLKVDGSLSTFEVKECVYTKECEVNHDKTCEVLFHADASEQQCSCGFFQFTGILCRHALSVLTMQQVYEIPPQYILNRWKKDIKQLHILSHYSDGVLENKQMDKYDYLSARCLQLAEVGTISDDKYQIVLQIIREVEKSISNDDAWKDLLCRLLQSENRSDGGIKNHAALQMDVTDGNNTFGSISAKRRGRLPKKRKESMVEHGDDWSSKKDAFTILSDGSQNNLVQVSSTISHLSPHDRTQAGIDLMEEVDPNNLSFGSHFGLHGAEAVDHLGNQQQHGYALQSQLCAQTVGSISRMQWINQQALQEDLTQLGGNTG